MLPPGAVAIGAEARTLKVRGASGGLPSRHAIGTLTRPTTETPAFSSTCLLELALAARRWSDRR